MRTYPLPYKTCVVLGHVCDREGKKECKSKGNYTPPEVILERVRMEFAALDGADDEGRRASSPAWRSSRAKTTRASISPESRAKVVVYRGDREAAPVEHRAPAGEEAAAADRRARPTDDRAAPRARRPRTSALDVKPNDVPRLPQRRARLRRGSGDAGARAPTRSAGSSMRRRPPWTNTRHSLTNVRATQKEFAIKLRNVYSFFTIYANIDGFSPADGNPTRPARRPRISREHGIPAGQGASAPRSVDALRARSGDARGDRRARQVPPL